MGRVIIRDEKRLQLRILHLLWKLVKGRVAIAEEHDMAAFAASIVPSAPRIFWLPIAMPRYIALDDLIDGADCDETAFYWETLWTTSGRFRVAGDVSCSEGIGSKLGAITVAEG